MNTVAAARVLVVLGCLACGCVSQDSSHPNPNLRPVEEYPARYGVTFEDEPPLADLAGRIWIVASDTASGATVPSVLVEAYPPSNPGRVDIGVPYAHLVGWVELVREGTDVVGIPWTPPTPGSELGVRTLFGNGRLDTFAMHVQADGNAVIMGTATVSDAVTFEPAGTVDVEITGPVGSSCGWNGTSSVGFVYEDRVETIPISGGTLEIRCDGSGVRVIPG